MHKLAITKNDLISSWSLFLVSLPLTAGIAIASKAPPEAGLISAVLGAIIFSFFSSSPLVVVGPAAGLSVFISAAATSAGDFYQLPLSVISGGVFLLFFSRFNVHKIIYVFPQNVAKGMAAGIGIILMMKMVPHLLGHDVEVLSSNNFIQTNGRNSFEEIVIAISNFRIGAVTITFFSFVLIWLYQLALKRWIGLSKISYAFIVVLAGIVLHETFKRIFPSLALTPEHMLRMENLKFSFHPFWKIQYPIWQIIKLGLIICALVILEGLVTLDIFQKLDPQHKIIDYRREITWLGIGNVLVGFLGGLPIMPVLIRSRANLEFGAKNGSSVLLHGIWILTVVILFPRILSSIPMASVSSILFVLGLRLIDLKEMNSILNEATEKFVPFLSTFFVIVFVDFFWGIITGFTMGLFYTLRQLTKRSMVIVNDDERFLLKIFKDVTLFHKSQLKDLIDSVPSGKDLLIDGTGNIFIEPEMEEWLLEYADYCKKRNCMLVFVKSNLAISKLFKQG